MEINANISECVKKVAGFGSNTYQNICTGSKAVVPWGIGDWIAALSLIFMLVILMIWNGRTIINITKKII